MINAVTSKDNKVLKLVRSLHKKKGRLQSGLYFAEGVRLVKEALNFANDKIEPINYVDKSTLSNEELKKYDNLGAEVIRQGKYAVVTMAGGQGTRLGHNGPKGTFKLGLENDKSIFEILIDSLKENNEKYGVIIPWYIMTSRENNEQTENFFKENNYFGYEPTAITFFKQGELPMCSEEGKLLIDETGLIKEAADGHGGIFESMRVNGVIYDMESRGVEWAFIGPVDNVLVKMVDSTLLGVCLDKNIMALYLPSENRIYFSNEVLKLSKPKTIKAQPKHIEIRAYNCSAYLILFIVFSPLQLQLCCSNAFFKSRTN